MQKKADIKRLLEKYSNEIGRGKARVLFVDECHLMSGDLEGYVWDRRNQRVEVPIINERERQKYYGALDLLSKRVLIEFERKGQFSLHISLP